MGVSNPKNIGMHVKTVSAVPPQAGTAAAVNGSTIDRQVASKANSAYLGLAASAVFLIGKSATTGAPSAGSLAVRVQHSPDGTTWADYTDPQTGAVAQIATDTTLTAADIELDVDLEGANRYVRAVSTIGAFTGGTAPATPYFVSCTLGGSVNEPI